MKASPVIALSEARRRTAILVFFQIVYTSWQGHAAGCRLKADFHASLGIWQKLGKGQQQPKSTHTELFHLIPSS